VLVSHFTVRLILAAVAAAAAFSAVLPVAEAQPAAAEQHAQEVKTEAPDKDELTWNLSAGGVLNTGNTESWQVNSGTNFHILRGRHGFTWEAQFAYGQANPPNDMVDEFQDTVKQFNARAVYDLFLTEMDGLVLSSRYRWDQFAGLDSRVQAQLGYRRYFLRKEKHKIFGELGYDFTYDNFFPDNLVDAMGRPIDSQIVHSGRGYLGYDNKINEVLTYVMGFEALVNLEQPEDVRITWDNALRSSIADNLELEINFMLKFDNVPVPTRQKTDTVTQVNLIYRLMEQKEESDDA
jgi:putative salt-induced outer membrane protein YdiY